MLYGILISPQISSVYGGYIYFYNELTWLLLRQEDIQATIKWPVAMNGFKVLL